MKQFAARTSGPAAGLVSRAPALLQRRCSCGSERVRTGACAECGKPAAALQRMLSVGRSDSALEAEAERVAERFPAAPAEGHSAIAPVAVQRASADAMSGAERAPDSVEGVLAGAGTPLGRALQQDMGRHFGHDFSRVRVHAGAAAAASAREVDAQAYTVGHHVVFGQGKFAPDTLVGRRLIAHELTHVVQQGGHSGGPAPAARTGPVVQRAGFGDLRLAEAGITPPTRGEVMMASADAWLDTDITVKAGLDVLKAALKEIVKGKNLAYNKAAGKERVEQAGVAAGLDKAAIAAAQAEWEWLADNHGLANKPAYQARTSALFTTLQSPLARISAGFPKSSAKYWLKNTPPQVATLLYQVADSELPIEQLYVYAEREGLVDYVRDQLGLASTQDPSKAQLKGFDTKKTVSGFDYLGADDFMTELDAKRDPLRASLPSGMDLSKVTESRHINEKNREVRSADFPNLLMALLGFSALVKRRRKLFLEDAKKHGYATPTTEELVYWTYVYFNSGEFGGLHQLKKHQGKQSLGDWIKQQAFPNAIKVLESFKMLKAMDKKSKIF
ncbi:MAG: DUF4157 domain-containing protein [Massilia sp.]